MNQASHLVDLLLRLNGSNSLQHINACGFCLVMWATCVFCTTFYLRISRGWDRSTSEFTVSPNVALIYPCFPPSDTCTHTRTHCTLFYDCAFMCVCLFVRKLTLKPLMRLNYSEQDFPSDRGGMMNVLIPITPLCLILSCIAKEENSVTALPTQTNKVEYKNARVHSFYMLDVLK